jgi:hypothetical protein
MKTEDLEDFFITTKIEAYALGPTLFQAGTQASECGVIRLLTRFVVPFIDFGTRLWIDQVVEVEDSIMVLL